MKIKLINLYLISSVVKLWAPVDQMSSFSAMPAVLVGEPGVVNILSSPLPSLLFVLSLKVQLIG